MLILGKSKDYYDYVVKDRGVDSYVVFNRGKTMKLSIHEWMVERYQKYERKCDWLLIAGLKAYIFEYDMSSRTNVFIRAYDIPDRKSIPFLDDIKTPVYAAHYTQNRVLELSKKRHRSYARANTGIFSKDICRVEWTRENPNLKSLGIPAFIPAEEIWDSIYNYLLHQKEPPEPKPVPDEIKLRSHGFDNNSFKGKIQRKKRSL